ncbi:MAG: YdcF family protein [Oscillospiraceae bacterium]|nr:YdcF family protein [Oscillospiraceae bacterium]
MTHITSFIHNHKPLCIAVGLLWLVGLFMLLFLTGHKFLGTALIGIGALMLFYTICPLLLQSYPIVKLLRTAVTVILVICVAYFCVVESFIIRDARTETETPADYIIVLGAGVNGTVPSLSLRDRLMGTYNYMTANPDCIAIVSGGQGEGEDITEAQCMRDWLADKGIAPERIIMEDRATCTLENLRYSMDIIDTLPIKNPVLGIVSSEYHLHRAKRLAGYVGIDVIGIAARTSYPTVAANYFIREAFAMTEQYVFGYEGV